jgi:Rrf2 family protein
MRITQWAEYGTHCAIYLAKELKKGRVTVTAHDVAKELAIEDDYAQQILQRLRKGGIIESVRGPTGGYKLLKDPKTTTLKDLVMATEGDTFEVICEARPLGDSCSATNACSLKNVWVALKQHVETYLISITLASLAESEGASPLVSITSTVSPSTHAQ